MRFVFLLAAVMHAVTAQMEPSGDATAPTTPATDIVCRIDDSQPAYMPNIYKCKPNERCCINEGLPACCGKNITRKAILEQVFLWGAIAAALLLLGIIGFCYFNDNYCCVSNDDDDTVGCLCCKRKRRTDHGKRINFENIMYPDVTESHKVDDPIFGRTGKPEDVPYLAHVEEEDRRRAQIIEVVKQDIAEEKTVPMPRQEKMSKKAKAPPTLNVQPPAETPRT